MDDRPLLTPAATAPLGTGVTLPYIDQGPSDGMPLVALHGLSDSALSWSPLLAELPADVRAIVPSQRGHGDADRPGAGYGPADLAADAVALLDAVAVDRAVVVGHSMGAHVAQHLAVHHPDRVRALVLVGAFPPLAGTSLAAEMDGACGALVDPVDPGFIEEFQRSTLAVAVPDAFLDAVLAESAKVRARVWQAAWAGMRDLDLGERLGDIGVPVLLVWGAEDAMADASMRGRLMRAVPHAAVRVHAGLGHAPHWEDPRAVARDIASFLHDVGTIGAGRAASGP